MPNSLLDSGISLILYLQSLGAWLTTPMQFFTFLGTENFFLFLLPILYWSVDASLGLAVGLILVLSQTLVGVLKFIFHGPRPYFYDPRVSALSTETSFGLPSGHALTAASVWPLIAAKLNRPWVWVSTVLLVFLIGLSRAYLGVHFPTDILLGWAIGAVLVWGYLRLEAPLERLFSQMPPGRQVGVVFAISLAMIFIAAAVKASLGTWTMPEEWLKNIGITAPGSSSFDPLALSGIITNTATLFGLASGLIWLRARGGFNTSGSFWNRIARFPVGLVGVLLLYLGLGAIFPRGEAFLPYLLRYLRYALVGFWVAGLAPWLFIRLKLASPQQSLPGFSGGKLEVRQDITGD